MARYACAAELKEHDNVRWPDAGGGLCRGGCILLGCGEPSGNFRGRLGNLSALEGEDVWYCGRGRDCTGKEPVLAGAGLQAARVRGDGHIVSGRDERIGPLMGAEMRNGRSRLRHLLLFGMLVTLLLGMDFGLLQGNGRRCEQDEPTLLHRSPFTPDFDLGWPNREEWAPITCEVYQVDGHRDDYGRPETETEEA